MASTGRLRRCGGVERRPCYNLHREADSIALSRTAGRPMSRVNEAEAKETASILG
jgi:hypothetical protein